MGLLSKEALIDVFNRYKGKISKTRGIHSLPEISKERQRTIIEYGFDTPQDALEKIRGTNNLIAVSFLLRGYEVSQAVGLVVDLNKDFDHAAQGTGFMIAPTILMTNHHVLADTEKARQFGVRMNYQRDLESNIDPYFEYKFDPDAVFFTDKALDFTIVGVKPVDNMKRIPLSEFGYLKLLEQRGKIENGEFCTLIQHPDGKPKQTAMFENQILFMGHDEFILYSTDSSFGSSGAPVFNYQWVVVALHHAGVPVSLDAIQAIPTTLVDEKKYPREANEGIRISAIMKVLKEKQLAYYNLITAAANAPMEESIPQNPFKYARSNYMSSQNGLEAIMLNHLSTPKINESKTHLTTTKMNQDANVIRINIPLEIRIGTGNAFQQAEFQTEIVEIEDDLEKRKKKKKAKPIHEEDERFSRIESRSGYNANFLNVFDIELQELYKPFSDKGVVALTLDRKSELEYTHFSVVMHKKRRMPIIAAVNIDGSKSKSIRRGSDNWLLDSRMDAGFQLDNSVYANNDLDRGHMVRREDPNWGEENEAYQANEDTFHYTNACPQHKDLNQKEWLRLEDYVLNSTKVHDLKVSVFTGPILDENYVLYREALVPAQFYKIVAMVKTDGNPSITGYVLTQKELISGFESVINDFKFGEFKTYQLPLARIEELTGLNLGNLKSHDPLKGTLESVVNEIIHASDLKL
jgi:endonuclease G